MRNYLRDVGDIVRKHGQSELREAGEVLAVGKSGVKPREFEEDEFEELMIFKFENYISQRAQEHFNPNP